LTPERGRPVRVANCSGFYGDRMSALAEMVKDGPVDVVTGDYLAEVTMLILAKMRIRRPGGGYASTFLRQLEPVAADIAERGIKVVVNAGGLDPAGLAQATRELLAKLGVELSVATVEGDDVCDRIPTLLEAGIELNNLDTGESFAAWRRDPLTANAYLGGFGIKAALDSGADIVVTGRVADASLVVGAAAWWWQWSPGDLDALAGAVVAGHVIECGAQATGGNFSGFRQIADLRHPGFPLAEVDRDGSSVITKHPGTGGAVTVDTVTAQLLYEVGAAAYLNPDVVARLDTVGLAAAGLDRVRISGVRGTVPPNTTKVAMTSIGGWQNSTTVILTGLDPDGKAASFEAAVRAGLADSKGITDLRFTRIGVAMEDASDQLLGSCLLHVSVQGDEESAGRPFSSLLVELALSNFPGIYFTSAPGKGAMYGAYWPTLIPQELLDHTAVLADGRWVKVSAPPAASQPTSDPADAEGRPDAAAGREASQPSPPARPRGASDGILIEAPLGLVANARSGDKGGNANVGLWVSSEAAWEWLRRTITTEVLRYLLPEAAELPIDRYELGNLRAINFVIRGLLDGGATEARRYDKQAKALGEWLRSRHVVIPVDLLRDTVNSPGSS